MEAGFTDAWERSPRSKRKDGFTCCHDPDLRKAQPDLDERIDFVLVRPSGPRFAGGRRLPGAFSALVVGDDVGM